MAKYYALIKDGFIQMDIRTGQLEIYEDEKSANTAKRDGLSVVPVDVRKSNKRIY